MNQNNQIFFLDRKSLPPGRETEEKRPGRGRGEDSRQGTTDKALVSTGSPRDCPVGSSWGRPGGDAEMRDAVHSGPHHASGRDGQEALTMSVPKANTE